MTLSGVFLASSQEYRSRPLLASLSVFPHAGKTPDRGGTRAGELAPLVEACDYTRAAKAASPFGKRLPEDRNLARQVLRTYKMNCPNSNSRCVFPNLLDILLQ